VPSLLRALVACGWFGIQTWIGGSAIYQLVNVTSGALDAPPCPFIGINLSSSACYLIFWGVQVGIISGKGVESIRALETWAAPFLIAMGLALLGWAYSEAGRLWPDVGTPSQFAVGGPKEGQFWSVFSRSLTAMVGFWATCR
jgi:NCS1 family nucleobase:cation symporter-1